MSISRVYPISGLPKDRQFTLDHAAEIEALEPGASISPKELNTTIDDTGKARVFLGSVNLVPRFLGTVTDEADMMSLHDPDKGLYVFPEDTCYRTDAQTEYRCLSVVNNTPAWQPISIVGLTTITDVDDDLATVDAGTGVTISDIDDDFTSITLP